MTRVLIVDDEKGIRTSLSRFLNRTGFTVELAADADQALALLARQPCDVVVSDIILPRITGVELLRQLRTVAPDAPVIMMTGEPTLETAIAAVRAGAHDYLTKPIAPDLFRRAVERAAQMKALIDEKRRLEAANREYQQNLESLVDARTQALREREARLREYQQELRALAGRIEEIREAERTQIAREIHDDLGQSLTGIKLDMCWIKGRLPAEPALHARIESLVKLVDETIGSIRRICSELRPGLLDDLGLAAAIEWQAHEFHKRTRLPCHCLLETEPERLDPARATALFRILQEALTNVMRHAQASEVWVSLRAEGDQLVLEVRDNGCGIQTGAQRPRSLGLLGMRERAEALGGQVDITSPPGCGTAVLARIPTNAPSAGAGLPQRPA